MVWKTSPIGRSGNLVQELSSMSYRAKPSSALKSFSGSTRDVDVATSRGGTQCCCCIRASLKLQPQVLLDDISKHSIVELAVGLLAT